AGQAQQPIAISLKQAVDAALEPNGNTRIQLAAQIVRQAEAQSAQARSKLLPDMSASIGQQSRTVNLSAYGLQSPGMQSPGMPAFVGPFNTFDARTTVSQKIFDLSSLQNYKAARTETDAARHQSESARDETAAEVAKAYLAAVRAQAVVETAKANLDLSEALL